MTVNWTEVAQSHLFENQTAAVSAAAIGIQRAGILLQADFGQRAFETFLGFMSELESNFAFGQAAEEAFEILRQFVVGRMRDQLIEITGNRADIFRDAPLIIIQDADETLSRLRDVVQR